MSARNPDLHVSPVGLEGVVTTESPWRGKSLGSGLGVVGTRAWGLGRDRILYHRKTERGEIPFETPPSL